MEITAKKLENVNPPDTATVLITVGVVLIAAGAIIKELGS
jgi:hypothetical protein